MSLTNFQHMMRCVGNYNGIRESKGSTTGSRTPSYCVKDSDVSRYTIVEAKDRSQMNTTGI
jgi:hypothetical protein